jgi:hypothetical protein
MSIKGITACIVCIIFWSCSAQAENGESELTMQNLLMLKQRLLLEHMAGDEKTPMQKAIRKHLDAEQPAKKDERKPRAVAWRLSASNPEIQKFENQYEPPENCKEWNSEQHMVECLNHKIRSRKKFLNNREGIAPNN